MEQRTEDYIHGVIKEKQKQKEKEKRCKVHGALCMLQRVRTCRIYYYYYFIIKTVDE